jgi:hypothetical protein
MAIKEGYEYLEDDFYKRQGKSGGQRCKICKKWITLPRKRKYAIPTSWMKCEDCSSKNITEVDFSIQQNNGKCMNWIDVERELPKTRKRFIAKCLIEDESHHWEGVVDVYFDPHVGWIRSEPNSKAPVKVSHYAEHPYVEEEIKNNHTT